MEFNCGRCGSLVDLTNNSGNLFICDNCGAELETSISSENRNEDPNGGVKSHENQESAFDFETFISYSHTDKKVARRIHAWLEKYKFPTRCGDRSDIEKPERIYPAFLDEGELSTAPDVDQKLKEMLNRSRSLVVLCSPESARSKYVNDEVSHFTQIGRKPQIHCILIC